MSRGSDKAPILVGGELASILLDMAYLELDRLALSRARATNVEKPWFNRQSNLLAKFVDQIERAGDERAGQNDWHDVVRASVDRHMPDLRSGETGPE